MTFASHFSAEIRSPCRRRRCAIDYGRCRVFSSETWRGQAGEAAEADKAAEPAESPRRMDAKDFPRFVAGTVGTVRGGHLRAANEDLAERLRVAAWSEDLPRRSARRSGRRAARELDDPPAGLPARRADR